MDVLIPLFAIFFIFGVPILAIATHFVLRPMVRDVINALQGKTQTQAEDLLGRVGRLEQAILDQSQQIDRLIEAETFRRQLESGDRARSAESTEI